MPKNFNSIQSTWKSLLCARHGVPQMSPYCLWMHFACVNVNLLFSPREFEALVDRGCFIYCQCLDVLNKYLFPKKQKQKNGEAASSQGSLFHFQTACAVTFMAGTPQPKQVFCDSCSALASWAQQQPCNASPLGHPFGYLPRVSHIPHL